MTDIPRPRRQVPGYFTHPLPTAVFFSGIWGISALYFP